MRRLASLALLLAAAGCASTGSYLASEYRAEPVPALPAGDVAHVVFLTGNTADLDPDDPAADAALRALAADAAGAGEDATVVFLGDLTPDGVPPEDAPGYAAVEALLRRTAAPFEGLEAEVVVVPGDRDWRRGEDGVRRLERLVEALFDDDVLTPGDQAGGPREDDPADGLRLVALDTAWWLLDREDRPTGEAEDQEVRTPGDVARILEQIVIDRRDDRVVVLAHHPLESRGEHAGYRTAGQGAAGLGLTALVARTFGRSRQDLASSTYRTMRDVLRASTASHERLVWAASHDHSLQTLFEQRLPSTRHFDLVSGTGGGEVTAAGRDDVLHVASRPGYQRLVYFEDGALWTETVTVDPATGASEVAFRTEVAGANPELAEPVDPDDVPLSALPDNLGGTVTLPLDAGFAISNRFSNSAFTRAVFGERYRDVWKTEITAPVVDMGTEAGGLVPVKASGGNQTTGLRLESGDGHVYDFRLLEKDGTSGLPFELREGLAADVLLELRASAVPYGAIVTAGLSEAAGVPTPMPEIVYVPDDPRLGRYRETFADRLATLELRPDDDVSDTERFAGFEDVISDESLREELREDQDHRVDQRAFLRARLIDLLVNDWDRHAGQWRWGAFEPEDLDPTLTGDEATRGKVYLPVPRDHDWAFYGIGGLIQPPLHLFDKRLQGFDTDYGSLVGLTTNGFDQDRRFLNQLTLSDWLAVVDTVQTRLSDAAIDDALAVLPGPVEAQLAPEWRRILRARRDGLGAVARDYYALHASIVDVVGSDEEELYEVTRQPSGGLDVVVRKFQDETPGAELYRRTFTPDETDEVRVYGLAGDDRFVLGGEGPERIALRVIAGAGDDVVDAPAGMAALYDTPDGFVYERRGPHIEDRRSDAPDVNLYDPTERVLGDRKVRPVVGYQATDGALLGASVLWEVPGFRLRPSGATHLVAVNVATATGGVAGSYTGRMQKAVGAFDLEIDALASTPRYARNFYGLGNASPNVDGEAARVDLARVQGRAGLGTVVGQGVRAVFGPTARYADPSPDEDFPTAPVTRLPDESLEAQAHAGGFGRLALSTADRAVNPRQGVRIDLEAAVRAGLTGAASTYGTLGGEAALYVPVSRSPQLTLALRGGADHRVGEFPFFDAAVLGGPGSLRGYRRERFAGRTAASASAEVRAKLLDVSAYVLPLQVGALGFVDAGRVWADVPTCADEFGPDLCARINYVGVDPDAGDGLQLGYGGGLWFGALDRAVLNLTVGVSDEATLFTLGLGFAY